MCDERGWGGHISSRWRHASRLTCFVAAATHAVSQSHLTSIQVQFETRARLSLDCCGLGLVTGWQMPQITPKSLKNEIRLPWKHGRHSICDSLVCRGTSTQIWPHFLANLTVSAKRRKAPYRRSHRDTCSQCAHRRVESEEWGFFFFFSSPEGITFWLDAQGRNPGWGFRGNYAASDRNEMCSRQFLVWNRIRF